MFVCLSAKQRHSSEGATTTYEMPNVDTQRPVSYQQLPSQTGQQHVYHNVDNPPVMSTITPYEQLNIHTHRPPVYEQLAQKR